MFYSGACTWVQVLFCWDWRAVSLGHSINHLSQDPSFGGVSALSGAPGKHLTVTHSSFDHRGRTFCACYRRIRPCNGHWSICRMGGWEAFEGQRFVPPCKASSVCRDVCRWECPRCLRSDWRMTLRGLLGVLGEESEINTELLMFVPSIDLFLCLPFISLCLAPSIFSLFVSLIDGGAWKSSLFKITSPQLLQTSSQPAHSCKHRLS